MQLKAVSYRAVQLWNDLPESLTNMESFNVFKNAIKGRALGIGHRVLKPLRHASMATRFSVLNKPV